MEGKASLVSNKKEFDEVHKMLSCKFPSMIDMQLDTDSVIVKIAPKTCYYSNYIRSFGSIDKVDF